MEGKIRLIASYKQKIEIEVDGAKNILYKFLVEEGALFNFLQYQSIEDVLEYIQNSELLQIKHVFPLICERWSDTKEGFSYWKTLQYKWDLYIETKVLPKYEKQHKLGTTTS